MLLNVAGLSLAQQPRAAEKDTVNADKAAKPVFYQANEDEESSKGISPVVYFIAGFVVVGGAIFLLRKKKK